METEDSPPGEAGFIAPKASKRKKSEHTLAADDDKMKQQLLNNNQFVSLADNPQATTSKATPVVSTAEKSAKAKQPPLVVKNVEFACVFDKMKTCDAKAVFKITRFGTKITCPSAEDSRKVEQHLQKSGFEYYTYDKPSDRPYRVVLRGLPLVDPPDLIAALKAEHDIEAQAAHIIKRKAEHGSVDESFYLVKFAKGYTTLKKLREITHLAQIVVRWEVYRNKRADVTQCTNCLYHGHGTRNCHLKPRCNSCGETHVTDKCQTKDATTKRCANCGGNHPATDRNCPKRAEYIRIRQQATVKNQPGRRTTKATPSAPALTQENFPALPNSSVTPPGAPKFEHPLTNNTGTNQRRLDPRIRAATYAHPQSSSTEGSQEEVLYSSAELWTIFTEFRGRLLRCKTKSDQVEVLGYMVCKYGVN